MPPGPRAWAWSTTDSPVGPLGLAATPDGLLTVVFHADAGTAERTLSQLERHLGTAPAAAPSACHDVLAEAADQLRDYFAGRLRAFSVPLDWSLSSGFNRRTLRELLAHVPYGTVVAYQDLATRLGDPGAARAVGTAMGSNPLPIVVPCHRVIGSDGGLGGFGPGLEAKRVLLSLEGVLPEPLF
ncbi:methylated-DNA--[protein]-cysteine S-methyltransferase [Streptomyces abikoensis]|uniref:Methylated-DNA--protein-cysteine methyltransferase n=1 Tax=Streptomyces luteoverticillatus TaxID=66425 RepID=A0A3Q9G510_STRLT|nr:methylated-DNA--[protein]-cysteine S-methyltransferase [Streptomyces luteoverticillatus]AZQ75441.1 methylated-DNA--[protein]-cysteine S-methyltransferase [Streptomyces luteoverticillatus]